LSYGLPSERPCPFRSNDDDPRNQNGPTQIFAPHGFSSSRVQGFKSSRFKVQIVQAVQCIPWESRVLNLYGFIPRSLLRKVNQQSEVRHSRML
jgi:hypothetical protein